MQEYMFTIHMIEITVSEEERCSRHTEENSNEDSKLQQRSARGTKQKNINKSSGGELDHIDERTKCQKKPQRVTRSRKKCEKEPDKEKDKPNFQKKTITSQSKVDMPKCTKYSAKPMSPSPSFVTGKNKDICIDTDDLDTLRSQDSVISQSLYYRNSQTQSDILENSQVSQSASKREPKFFKSRAANSVQNRTQDTSLYDFEPEADEDFQFTNKSAKQKERQNPTKNKGRRNKTGQQNTKEKENIAKQSTKEKENIAKQSTKEKENIAKQSTKEKPKQSTKEKVEKKAKQSTKEKGEKIAKQRKPRKQSAKKTTHNVENNATKDCKLQKLHRLTNDERDLYVSDFKEEDENLSEIEWCSGDEEQSPLKNTLKKIMEKMQNVSRARMQNVIDIVSDKSTSQKKEHVAKICVNKEQKTVAEQSMSSRSEKKGRNMDSPYSQISDRSDMKEKKTGTRHCKSTTQGFQEKPKVTPPQKTKKKPKSRQVAEHKNVQENKTEDYNLSEETEVQSIGCKTLNRATLDDGGDADSSTNVEDSSVTAFTEMCKGLLARSGGQGSNKRTRAKKLVSYKDLSDSEASEDLEDLHVEATITMPYKHSEQSTKQKPEKFTFYAQNTKNESTIHKSQKKKKRSVFSETDADESRSEVSWLASSARKKKAQARTYTGKEKTLPVKPKMITDERIEDVSCEVLMSRCDELKDKTDRNKWKAQSPCVAEEDSDEEDSDEENLNLDYEPATKKRNLIKEKQGSKLHPLPMDNALLAKILNQLSASAELERSAENLLYSKQATHSRKRECTALKGTVCKTMTPKSDRQYYDDNSIEEMRFEDDLQSQIIMDSPIMPTQLTPGSKSLPADDEDDEDQLEIGTQYSNITHISSLKTPRTPAHDRELMEEEEELMEEDLDEVHKPVFEVDDTIGWKSGPSKSTRLPRSTKESLPESEESDGEESINSTNIEPEYTPFQPRKASDAEDCLKPRKLFNQGADNDLDSDAEDATKSSDADVGIRTGVSSVLQSFSSEIQQSVTRRQCVEKFTKETVDATNRQISSIWNQQCNKRHKLMDKFEMSMLQEVTSLEGDIDKLKQSEERTMVFFQKEQKIIRTCLHSQGQRLKKLKQTQLGFSDEVQFLEKSQEDQQGSVQDLLRKEMREMQKNIMKQSQQQEILNVKKTLMQTLFL